MKKPYLALAAALLSLLPAFGALEWLTDLPTAQQQADEQHKVILADFTGSDWCGWCIRLKKNVLDTPEFERFAAERFIPLEIDLPQRKDFPAAQRAANEALVARYNISGFPTILVLAPDGTVVGGFGGGLPDVAAAREPLEAALDNARAYAEATRQTVPDDQLSALLHVYRSIPEDVREHAESLRERLIALDPEDSSGLRREREAELQRASISQQLRQAQGPEAMLVIVDQWLNSEQLAAENQADLLSIKAQILLTLAQNADDIAAAKQTALKALELDPQATPELRQRIEAAFSDPERLLKRAAEIRARMKK
ncbi:MAG: thioredoxin family protein [Akkermansia sp.]